MRKRLLWIGAVIISLFITGNTAYSQQHFGSDEQAVSYTGSRTGDVIYNQMGAVGSGWISAMEMTNSADKTKTSFAADDFIVPEGETWDVSYMKLIGGYPDSENTSDTLHVFFYENDNGIPGDVIYSYENITEFNQTLINDEFNMYEFEITLPETVSFNEGQYWMCVQVKTDNGVQGRWVWYNNGSTTIENPYYWKNPLDGFESGFTDWTSSELVLYWGPYNLNFALYGEGFNKDMAAMNVSAPETLPGLTSSEAITVSIKNEGTEPQSGFNLSYSVNGGAAVTENIGTTLIGPNQIYDFTFATSADLSVAGEYEIEVTVSLTGDENVSNNTFAKSIYNLGEIYQITDTTTVTTCSGTFTDPGGLDGGVMSGMTSLTTFYPESEGDRVRLTFLTFDPGWCDKFAIYDGENTDANLIGEWENVNSPGVITALNSTGALTVDFKASGWDTGFGWSAFISCFTPADDDFAVTSINSSATTVFTGTEITLTAGVLNYGTLAQAKDVTFTANGNVIGTVNTGDLASGIATEVSMLWTPTVGDDYVIEASVVADAGSEDNNAASMDLTVFPFDAFYETFESGLFPPEEWSSTEGFWAETTQAFAGEHAAQAYVPYESAEGDTLISPRLIIEDGATLKFPATSAPWWPGKLQILWKNGTTGEWNFLQDIALPYMGWENYEIDMSAAAGEGNYIGFRAWFDDPWSFGGQVTIDEVMGVGITRFFNNNDIKSNGIEGSQFVNAFEESVFNFSVKNNGLNAQSAGTYTVKLMQVAETGDIELTSVGGQYINSMQKIEYELPYSFTEIGPIHVYATVDFPADENLENNASNIIEAIVLPGGSNVISIGIEDESGYMALSPVNVNYENSLSETIYTSEEISQDGLITGISYDYTFVNNVEDVPVRIWIGQTDSTNLQGLEWTAEWIPATELTLVYDGNLNYSIGSHSIFIQLETPYLYDNSNSIVIMTEKILDDYFEYNNRFTAHLTVPNNATINWYSIEETPNPENPGSMGGYPSVNSVSPNIHFIFNNDVTTFNGTVADETGNTIADATVTVNGLALETNTNATGFYEFNQVPAATYIVTASAFGYYNNTQEVNVYVGSTSVLDFTMEAIPTYAINGVVVGSNDETVGLQGGTVTLNGYDAFDTFTNPGGTFAINGVYNFGTYSLEIWVPGYEVYTAELEVTENLDLGTIVLNELYVTAFNAVGTEVEDQVSIVWNAPNQLAEDVMVDDDGSYENGYCAEPFEEVSLGNLFENNDLITLTSVDLFWAEYANGTSVPVRLDIYDAATEELLASSQAFNTGLGEDWITVDVPNLTLTGDFYVMVYWNGTNGEPSSYLGTDFSEPNANNAYYYYPNSNFYEFESLIGYPCNFMIRPNIMTEATRGGDREVLSYNVYKGMANDVSGFNSWDKINNFPVTETSFNDTEWPPVYTDDYMYAVEAIYTEGNSEVVFSTPVHFQEPILPVENLVATDSLGYTIGWALIEWNAPQGANPIAYNIYLNNNSTPVATVTGTSYTFHDLPAETYAVGVTAVYNSGESAAEVVMFTITIDVEDMEANGIAVYPNPATEYVVLDMQGSAKVEIFNTIGDIVKSIENYNSGNEINIENLEAGAYFFRITNNDHTSIQKVIVK
ncbi:MAG: carboxypeptidase regulatory-like domain-containing protein [Bacteroidales bacterium]|nr:carboxypeptidase regulatory-like domain-containing protein [Bacteroidales bacterium]